MLPEYQWKCRALSQLTCRCSPLCTTPCSSCRHRGATFRRPANRHGRCRESSLRDLKHYPKVSHRIFWVTTVEAKPGTATSYVEVRSETRSSSSHMFQISKIETSREHVARPSRVSPAICIDPCFQTSIFTDVNWVGDTLERSQESWDPHDGDILAQAMDVLAVILFPTGYVIIYSKPASQ